MGASYFLVFLCIKTDSWEKFYSRLGKLHLLYLFHQHAVATLNSVVCLIAAGKLPNIWSWIDVITIEIGK